MDCAEADCPKKRAADKEKQAIAVRKPLLLIELNNVFIMVNCLILMIYNLFLLGIDRV
jgi:hypothetical protein